MKDNLQFSFELHSKERVNLYFADMGGTLTRTHACATEVKLNC